MKGITNLATSNNLNGENYEKIFPKTDRSSGLMYSFIYVIHLIFI